MLFRDRSRAATQQPHSITPPSQTGGLTPMMTMEQGPTTGMHATSFAPGEVQASLVPSSSTAPRPGTPPDTQSLRIPVVIPATGKKSTKTMRPPKGRRVVVNIGVAVVLIAILFGILAAVVPVGNGQASGLAKLLNPSMNMISSKQNSTALIAAQAATATAVTQDGFDAGNQTYAGVTTSVAPVVSPSDAGSLDRFFYGQCTYWANMRYHELTGHWVPWLGNADEWAYQASAYGWQTSSVPNPNGPSIIVLGPGVEGAGSYGHVAVVETGVTDYSNGISTSNWNWNGDWGIEDWWTFYVGPGVTFVWY